MSVWQAAFLLCRKCLHEHEGARRGSVVRAFARGAMGHRINPSW